jgi:hypothetical protein
MGFGDFFGDFWGGFFTNSSGHPVLSWGVLIAF